MAILGWFMSQPTGILAWMNTRRHGLTWMTSGFHYQRNLQGIPWISHWFLIGFLFRWNPKSRQRSQVCFLTQPPSPLAAATWIGYITSSLPERSQQVMGRTTHIWVVYWSLKEIKAFFCCDDFRDGLLLWLYSSISNIHIYIHICDYIIMLICNYMSGYI